MKVALVHMDLTVSVVETEDSDILFGGETVIPQVHEFNRVYRRNKFGFTVAQSEERVLQNTLTFYVHPEVTKRYPHIKLQDLALVVLASLVEKQDMKQEFLVSRFLTDSEILAIDLYENGSDEEPETDTDTETETETETED